MRKVIEPYASTSDVRKAAEQMIAILDMADAESSLASAGLVVLAEDHAKAMMRRLRPYVKKRVNDAWPRTDDAPSPEVQP